MIKKFGNGYVGVGVTQEDLEVSISGLQGLKPILQKQVLRGNGSDRLQGIVDAAELGKHFDTAIESMTMLLAGFSDYQN